MQSDPDKHVVAASEVKADDHPHLVTSVLDTKTGETVTYDTREPLPWLAANQHREIGLYYGVKNGIQTLRLDARADLLQVKALHVQAVGTVDAYQSGPVGVDYFAGVGVAYRF